MSNERVDNLDRMIEEGRVIRHAWWVRSTASRERACLLAALSPEAGRAQTAFACPASVMPGWLAHLTVSMDDNGSDGAWPSMVRRYAALARRWGVLDDAAWERAKSAVLVAVLDEAARHTEDKAALTAIADVRECIAEGSSEADLKAAARAAADAAAWAAAGAPAGAAAGAARAAAGAAAWAADAAAWAAAWAAADAAAGAARAAAGAASWDRMTSEILDAIETEIERAEG